MFLFGVYYSVSGPFLFFAAGKFCFYLFLACPFFSSSRSVHARRKVVFWGLAEK
jgi:hypothetical protein